MEDKQHTDEGQESHVPPGPTFVANATSSPEQPRESLPVDHPPSTGLSDSLTPETTTSATEGSPTVPLVTDAPLDSAIPQSEISKPTPVEQNPVPEKVDKGMGEQDVEQTETIPATTQNTAEPGQSAPLTKSTAAALPTESNGSPPAAGLQSAEETTNPSLNETEDSQSDGQAGLAARPENVKPEVSEDPPTGAVTDSAADSPAPHEDGVDGQAQSLASELPLDDVESDSEDIGTYMPLVLPTTAYQPPAPSLFKHTPKSSMSAVSAVSKVNSKSFRRSAGPASLLSTITSPSLGRKKRSPSVASSGASTVDSNHSATIEIPEPQGQPTRSKHTRDKSDPKYLRFLTTVSDGQKKTEPERYVGYPGLVSHMTETQSLIFRRFDAVHVRLLLYLQDQISQLEARLKRLDEMNTSGKGMHNGTFRDDADPYRQEIMERLRILVGEYDIMILTFSKMQEVQASDKAVARLKDWLKKYTTSTASRPASTKGGPIAKDELDWLEKSGDLSNLAVGTATVTTTQNTVAAAIPDSPSTTSLTKAKQLNRKSTLSRLLTGKRR